MMPESGPILLGEKRWRWDGTPLFGQMGRVSVAVYDSGHLAVVWPAGVPNPGLDIREYSNGDVAEAVGRLVASFLEDVAERADQTADIRAVFEG